MISSRSLKAHYYRTAAPVALVGMMWGGAATAADPGQAAQAAPAQSAQAPQVEEVVITGSAIVRNGYEAPTPLAVLSADMLNAEAPQNIADAVNQMPQFANSVTPTNSGTNVSSGTAGVNQLNLRGLNPDRTLVLLDGQRIVGATLTGFVNNGSTVDINIIPDGLIQRVDIVTGGASAVYGSDALAGVVNFVLDHNFTGLKGSVQGGVTTYGDDRQWNVSLTAGTGFAGDRGHILIFGQAADSAGITGQGNRPWANQAWQVIANPSSAPGQPTLLALPHIGLAIATPGGMIDDGGPLNGIAFGPGGKPFNLNMGTVNNGFLFQGGDYQYSRIDQYPPLDIPVARQNAFTRLSYDLTDDIQVFAELEWGVTHAVMSTVPDFSLGGDTITADNPFIPAPILAAMTANGLTNIGMGSTNADLGQIGVNNIRTFRRYVLGASGKIDAVGTTWSWDTYYEQSTSNNSTRSPNNLLESEYTEAIDAVRAPNGSIVCRSTLTHPNNGCVPYDIFGTGVNSQAAINFVTGTGFEDTWLKQDVASFTMRGDPLSDWAGPVSLAFGATYRYESVTAIASADDIAANFLAGNYHPSVGHYGVGEGFVETVIPLAKDTAWAKALDLNAAIRATNYSVSGYVTTWKVGANYSPVDDVRFRVTQSRDIRAPNLGELFSAGQSGTSFVTDPTHNNVTDTIIDLTKGNLSLVPEKADTTGLGVVLQPSFFPGFNGSFDFYRIKIGNAITALVDQQYINGCYSGDTALCPYIERNSAGVITQVNIEPANVLDQEERGFDIEASYKLALADMNSNWNGNLTFHGLGTYVISLKTTSQFGVIEGANNDADGLSEPFAPRFRYNASVDYNNDPVDVTLTARGISPGRYDNLYIQCSSNCPASTATNPTINNNHVDGVIYLDLSFNYKIHSESMSAAEVFLTVQNIANTAPPIAAGGTSGGFYAGQANSVLYDRLGRVFRTGVRFKM